MDERQDRVQVEDTIRVLRILEYLGPRSKVEEQIQRSLHGTRIGNGVRITATTLGEYGEIVKLNKPNLANEPGGQVYTSYVLVEESREGVLSRFPPKFPDVYARHVTREFGIRPGPDIIPPVKVVKVVGYVSDESLEALIVSVDRTTTRPDGGTFHLTLSLDRSKGRKPKDSNDVILSRGWVPVVDQLVLMTYPKVTPL